MGRAMVPIPERDDMNAKGLRLIAEGLVELAIAMESEKPSSGPQPRRTAMAPPAPTQSPSGPKSCHRTHWVPDEDAQLMRIYNDLGAAKTGRIIGRTRGATAARARALETEGLFKRKIFRMDTRLAYQALNREQGRKG